MKSNIQVPFKEDGSLLTYVDYGTRPVWRDAATVTMTLTYDHYERGRSAAHTIWRREDGAKFPMFLTCLDDLFAHADIYHGQVTADWTFIKRGSNYSICLVGYEDRQTEAKRAAAVERAAYWAAYKERNGLQ